MEGDNKMVKALILRSAGINCNDETEQAFRMAGAETEQVHVNQLISGEKKLSDYHVLALPGGFSYGDYVAAGTILANQLSTKLKTQIDGFIENGKIILGICNGFQALVKMGLLPGGGIKATLTNNDSGKFECRWIKLKKANDSPLTKGMDELNVPVAHGEGKFVTDDVDALEKNNQIIFKYSSSDYPENPSGSMGNIAGISNKEGNVIGLMPHPERHLTCDNHPEWQRRNYCGPGEGLELFRNVVEYCRGLKIEKKRETVMK